MKLPWLAGGEWKAAEGDAASRLYETVLPNEERAMSLGVVMVKKSELQQEDSGCFIFTLSLGRCVKGYGCLSQKTPRWDVMVGLWFYSGVESLRGKSF